MAEAGDLVMNTAYMGVGIASVLKKTRFVSSQGNIKGPSSLDAKISAATTADGVEFSYAQVM